MIAPDLINAEVLSVIRGWLLRSLIDEQSAARAVGNLASAPVRRVMTAPLISRIWGLRANVTPYAASYLSLAHRVGCPLLTLDRRLAGAPDIGVQIRTVT